jgi:hypothetical protein
VPDLSPDPEHHRTFFNVAATRAGVESAVPEAARLHSTGFTGAPARIGMQTRFGTVQLVAVMPNAVLRAFTPELHVWGTLQTLKRAEGPRAKLPLRGSSRAEANGTADRGRSYPSSGHGITS